MNEPNLPPDELASAFLDGELARPAADAVARDPEAAATVEELRRAAGAVAAPAAPPPGAADAAVEAALADFEARRAAVAEPARLRARRLPLIAGVAAAVAVGFIVAAALGLFAERESVGDTAGVAAPADEPAAASAAEAEAAAEMALPPPAEPAPAPEVVLAPPAELAEMAPPADDAVPQAAADDEPAMASDAATTAAEARAAAEQAESAAAPEDLPPPALEAAMAPEAAPAAEGETMAGDDGAMAAQDAGDTTAAEPSATAPADCAGALGDRTVEARITVADTHVLLLRDPDGHASALNAATCDDIPAAEADAAAAAGCAGALGDRTVEARITVAGTHVLLLRDPDGHAGALNAATCDDIPPTEPG